jgi:hypothetical protein
MKSTELRIGNWIADYECEPYYFQVEEIKKHVGFENWVCYRNGSVKAKDPSPIPLTEELLVKMGFEKNGYGYWTHTKEYFELGENGGGEYCNSINCFEYSNGKNIKYVHQLQNLYFALTGEELKINLVD